jgi:hypothetical protein
MSARTGHAWYRPMLDVKISYGEKAERLEALIDSGTELTILDVELAERLGIVRDGRELATIYAFAGQKTAFLAPVSIAVPGFDEVIDTTVLFAEDPEFDMILGQDDFFRRFLVKFEKSKNKFYLDVAR